MTDSPRHAPPVAATSVAPPKSSWISFYPEQFRIDMSGILARRLGDAFGLTKIGINMMTLAPGSVSAMRHYHMSQDEFVYVMSGELILRTDAGETVMKAGDCIGFKAGVADGHCLENRSAEPATYLAIGDRGTPETVHYSDIDLVLQAGPEVKPRGFSFAHKDGTAY